MSSRSTTLRVIFLSTLCGCLPLVAQTRHSYVQLSDGTSGHIIVVNGSPKTIEAFHFRAKCGNGSTEFSRDKLDFVGAVSGWRGPDGKLIEVSDVVRPWARVMLIESLPQGSGKCAWEPDIDAVLYEDGSYEGGEEVARNLQARRDGIAHAVKSFADSTVLRPPPQAGAKPQFPQCVGSKIACNEYEQARQTADRNVGMACSRGDSSKNCNDKVSRYALRWQKKIKDDLALKKLDAVFAMPVIWPGDLGYVTEDAMP